MNRSEYLRILSEKLSNLPHEEYCNIMEYYTEYFEDAGGDDAAVIEELGSPENLAAKIIEENMGREAASGQMYGQNVPPYPYPYPYPQQQQQQQPSGLSTGWKVVIAILTFPIWIGIVAAVIGVVFGFGGAAVGCFVASIVTLVAGFAALFSSISTGVLFIGAAFIVAAVALGFLMAVTGIVHLIVKLLKYIFARNKQQAV